MALGSANSRSVTVAPRPGIHRPGRSPEIVRGRAAWRRRGWSVSLVAHYDDPLGQVADLRDVVRTAGVEPPFQDVAVDDQGVVEGAVALALLNWPDIDDERTGCCFVGEVFGSDPIEAGAGGGEQAVYRAHRPERFFFSGQPARGAYMITATPSRRITAPAMS